MTGLSRRTSDALDLVGCRDLGTTRRRPPAHIQRAVHEAVATEHGRGLVQGARVRAVEYVANEGMQAVAGLSELEALYIQRTPLGEHRYRAIADTAAFAVANIVAEAGRT